MVEERDNYTTSPVDDDEPRATTNRPMAAPATNKPASTIAHFQLRTRFHPGTKSTNPNEISNDNPGHHRISTKFDAFRQSPHIRLNRQGGPLLRLGAPTRPGGSFPVTP